MMTQRLWLGFLLLAGGSTARGQVQPQPQETALSPHPSLHLLTAAGGRAIVNAASERDRQVTRKPGSGVTTTQKPDCSHLVHEVYTLAGYPYPYVSSFDLYAGVSSFARVTRPQAGDLVVWRGHVGIVVDPVEHSFYSSVRPGLRTDFYDAPAWTARGPARFYRYAVRKSSNFVLAENRAAKTPSEPALTSAGPAAGAFHESLPDAVYPMTQDSDSTASATLDTESSPAPVKFEVPSKILIAAAEDKPSQAEIAGAIAELNSGTGDILREQDLAQLGRRVIIYDDLTLDRPKFKNKSGEVQAWIVSRVTLAAGHVEQVRHHEAFRWDLVRTNDGWQVLAPKNMIYVPRDVAVRMLAARLALLTQQGNGSDTDSVAAQAQIVRILNTLFN